MATYTSTLPDKLWAELGQTAKRLKTPKNKLIEKALSFYLEQLDKAEYKKSYKRMAKDEDMIQMAEEGMADYFQQLQEWEQE